MDDALALWNACHRPDDPPPRGPYHFASPLEPAVAAEAASLSIDPKSLLDQAHALRRDSDFLLVEGCWGLQTPLSSTHSQIDLIEQLALPVLLVLPSEPGIIHEALMIAQALGHRSLPLAGIIIVRLHRLLTPEEAANPRLIEAFLGPSVRGVVPFYSTPELQNPSFQAARLEVHVDLPALLGE